MMYVALSYDHRLIDGREAVQFLVRLKECVEESRSGCCWRFDAAGGAGGGNGGGGGRARRRGRAGGLRLNGVNSRRPAFLARRGEIGRRGPVLHDRHILKGVGQGVPVRHDGGPGRIENRVSGRLGVVGRRHAAPGACAQPTPLRRRASQGSVAPSAGSARARGTWVDRWPPAASKSPGPGKAAPGKAAAGGAVFDDFAGGGGPPARAAALSRQTPVIPTTSTSGSSNPTLTTHNLTTGCPRAKLGRVDFARFGCYERLVRHAQSAAVEPAPRGGGGRRRVDVLLEEEDRVALLRAEARRGLTATPKKLPPKWFYDGRGSDLFEEITRQPEYYLTRREREILTARAGEIAALTPAETLVELGAGSAEKTRVLLDALERLVPCAGSSRSTSACPLWWPRRRQSRRSIHRSTSGGWWATFTNTSVSCRARRRALARGWWRLLGSTIGNFDAEERLQFFRAVHRTLRHGDFLLLGADRVKAKARLEAAYNDAAGVTAAFNKNVLRVLNRDLDATFDEDRFDHVARYDRDRRSSSTSDCGPAPPTGSPFEASASTSLSPRARRCAPKSARSSPASASRACSARPVFRACGSGRIRRASSACRFGPRAKCRRARRAR